MIQTLVSTKYRVVIPKAIREQIKIQPRQKLNVDIVGKRIILTAAKKKAPSFPKT